MKRSNLSPIINGYSKTPLHTFTLTHILTTIHPYTNKRHRAHTHSKHTHTRPHHPPSRML